MRIGGVGGGWAVLKCGRWIVSELSRSGTGREGTRWAHLSAGATLLPEPPRWWPAGQVHGRSLQLKRAA